MGIMGSGQYSLCLSKMFQALNTDYIPRGYKPLEGFDEILKRLKEMIITEDSDDHSSTKDVEFTTNHPDVVLSKMGNYINVKLSIKEIEKQILKILEAASLPADTLMVLSRNTNMARRMDVLSSEYYAMVDEVIGADTSAKRNAANMIKPLAMQAMIVSKNAEK